jgi:hypothetical protein
MHLKRLLFKLPPVIYSSFLNDLVATRCDLGTSLFRRCDFFYLFWKGVTENSSLLGCFGVKQTFQEGLRELLVLEYQYECTKWR